MLNSNSFKHLKDRNIYILTGKIHSGKTSFLQKMCDTLKTKGSKINGLLSPAFYESKTHKGYNGFNIKSEELFALARLDGNPEWEKAGQYYFIPEGLKKAEESILDFQNCDLTIIDEIGPLEMKEKGLWKAACFLFNQPQNILIVLRESILDQFLSKTKEKANIFWLKDNNLTQIMTTALAGKK